MLPHEKVWTWFQKQSQSRQIILASALVLSCVLCISITMVGSILTSRPPDGYLAEDTNGW